MKCFYDLEFHVGQYDEEIFSRKKREYLNGICQIASDGANTQELKEIELQSYELFFNLIKV